MTCSLSKREGWCGYQILVILISLLAWASLFSHSQYGALAAPQPTQQQQPQQQQQQQKQQEPHKQEDIAGKSAALAQVDQQKTADLTLLINETLKINNKSTVDSSLLDNGTSEPNFHDDWTFDRVEYDLMDFLQELNARYRYANKSTQSNHGVEGVAASPIGPTELDERKDGPAAAVDEEKVVKTIVAPDCAHDKPPPGPTRDHADEHVRGTTIRTSTIEEIKKELDAIAPINSPTPPTASVESNKTKDSVVVADKARPTAIPTAALAVAVSSELPVSLASGDYDISESNWQYGIFDRFTRSRSSTTSTAAPTPDTLSLSGANVNFDMRQFNSDECGLRGYQSEMDYFPTGDELSIDEMTKELSQRRQRPPLGSSFFHSHKKCHHTASGDSSAASAYDDGRDELDRGEPPYDRYGEPTSGVSDISGGSPAGAVASSEVAAPPPPPPLSEQSNKSKYHQAQAQAEANDAHQADSYDDGTAMGGPDGAASPGSDNEFNLSLRRQWLQQKLGSTLQLLGFNTTGGGGGGSSGGGGGGGGGGGYQSSVNDYFNQTYNMRENMMKMSRNKLGKSHVPSASAKSHKGMVGGGGGGAKPGETNEQELKSRQDELKLEARVIGGNDARLGDSPWSASLQALVSRPGTGGVEYRHYCGGTIISEYYILTAAHCLDFMVGRESRLFVMIGDLNWRMSVASLHGRRFGIEKLIIHGGYKSTAFGHDIGLIKTKESMRPLKVNGRYIINSVCLPERNAEHTGEAELVGWGLFSNRNEMADSLQIADVPILPRPLCVDLYKRRTGLIQWLIGIELITEKQICAGTFGRGICQGDSGSALVYNEKVRRELEGKSATRLKSNLLRDQQLRATIIGIVAFGGIRRCSYQSLPGVYMQTSKYLDWILPRISQ